MEEENYSDEEDEAIDWFNNLDSSTKCELIKSQYKIHVSLKDTATKKLINSTNRKWKGIVEEKDSKIKMLLFENDAITNTLSKLNVTGLESGSGNPNTQKILSSLVNQISLLESKIESKIDSKIKLQQDPIKNFYDAKDYYSHIEVVLSSQGYLLKKINSNESYTNYNVTKKNIRGYIECFNELQYDESLFDIIKENIVEYDTHFDFVMCIVPKAKYVRTESFFIDFFNTDYGTTLLVCIADTIIHTERISSCSSIVETYIGHHAFNNKLKNTNKNINKIISQIENLKQINTNLINNIQENNNTINNLSSLVENIKDFDEPAKESAESAKESAKESSKEREVKERETKEREALKEKQEQILLEQLNSDDNKNQKICVDIVKFYLLNSKPFIIKDIVTKAKLFGITQTFSTLIIKQLGGIKGIKDLAKKDIANGNMLDPEFKFDF
jgi:hypothetical protein